MEDRYYRQTVEVVIKRGSDLFRRIEALAEAKGCTFEQMFECVAETGLYHHMDSNVAFMEKYSHK